MKSLKKDDAVYYQAKDFGLLGWGYSEEEGCAGSFNISHKGTTFKPKLLENY